MTVAEPLSTSSEPDETSELLGSTLPRLFTPPLVEGPPGPCACGCALTPETSYGFDVDDFATNVLEMPFDDWERWLVIHGGEMLPDGRPRFRKLLVIVARQNGKTHVLVVLSLFWLFVERVLLVLGTSTNLDYAKESWEKAVTIVEDNDVLYTDVPRRGGIRRSNGEQTLKTVERCRYKIAAATRRGGRSLTIRRLILDELREHHDWSAWNAAYNAMNAVRDAQCWAITNQGDEKAVVLDSLRSEILDEDERVRPLEQRDVRTGLFEYSAPPGSRADDPVALSQANPNMDRHPDRGPFLVDLLADARRALRNGGEELAEFLTEVLCLRVPKLQPAINMDNWHRPVADGGCLDPGSLDGMRDRVAMCIDVSEDGLHATLYAAAKLDDDRVRVDVVKAWSGPDEMRRLKPDLDKVITQQRPRALGWFPGGPGAAIAADLVNPPKGVTVEPIRQDVTAVCMGFAKRVDDGAIAQSAEPLADAHLTGAEKLQQGDGWRFVRQGAGHVDGAYAVAGATHIALTVPAPPRPRVRTFDTRAKTQN